jgi:Lrp/AsnC family transcriptional regulator, leucine-responsive regulatory protein
MFRKHMSLSLLDSKLLKRLMEQGRATWAELASDLGLSAPAVAERVRKLEERGLIRGYAAIPDPARLGYGLTAFVAVTLERPKHREKFIRALTAMPEVAECHHIAGDFDYLLKVRCRGTADLDDLLSNRIKELPGIARTRTTIALGTIKESVLCPVENAEERKDN